MGTTHSTSDVSSVAAPAPVTMKRWSRYFLAVTALTSAVVLLFGWATGLRDWMHTSLITFCVFALFPFVVLCAVLALLMLFALACALIGASVGADDVLPDGFTAHAVDGLWGLSGGISVYYRWLARHRGSAWLGLRMGLLAGGLLLWAALGLFVVPREAATAARLQAAKALIEDSYRRAGRYPQADERGSFIVSGAAADVLAEAVSPTGELLDGFGQRVQYLVTGRGKLASYRLRSPGFDGIESADDLCASGETRLRLAMDLALLLHELVNTTKLENHSLHQQFEDIRAATCPR